LLYNNITKEKSMSANGKVGIVGISKSYETLVTFKREHDGTYTKQTKRLTRDRLSSSIKYHKKDNPVMEEGPFVQVTHSDEYDEKMEFEDYDGNMSFLYFKKIEHVEEEEE
tara:strand:+ start:1186 stop:1518 length:333 start_codon:yes stop_codon:yes gene_type:complete